MEARKNKAATPVISRHAVHFHKGSGILTVEASDALLLGFPQAVQIPARDGSFVRYGIKRDPEGEATHAVYKNPRFPRLTIFND